MSRGQNAEARSGSDASAREGLAMSVMSNNDIEGDPLQFLRVSEAYWQVSSSPEALASLDLTQGRVHGILAGSGAMLDLYDSVQAMKSAPAKRGPAVIRVRHRRLQQAFDCDVAVCGGTLGLLLALALQVSPSISALCTRSTACVSVRTARWQNSSKQAI